MFSMVHKREGIGKLLASPVSCAGFATAALALLANLTAGVFANDMSGIVEDIP